MALTPKEKEHLQQLITRGEKVQALKYLTSTFGLSLVEAKQIVDAIEKKLKKKEKLTPVFEKPLPRPAKPKNKEGKADRITDKPGDTHEEAFKTAGNALSCTAGCLFTTIYWLSLAIGSILALSGIYILLSTLLKYDQGIIVSGEIISTPEGQPAILYKYDLYADTLRLDSLTAAPYTPGEEVEVLVNSQNPDDVMFYTFMNMWGETVFLIFFASFFLVVAFIMYLIRRNQRPAKKTPAHSGAATPVRPHRV